MTSYHQASAALAVTGEFYYYYSSPFPLLWCILSFCFLMRNIKWKDSACDCCNCCTEPPICSDYCFLIQPTHTLLHLMSSAALAAASEAGGHLCCSFRAGLLYSGVHPLLCGGLEIVHWVFFCDLNFYGVNLREAMWATCESACCLLMSLSDALRCAGLQQHWPIIFITRASGVSKWSLIDHCCVMSNGSSACELSRQSHVGKEWRVELVLLCWLPALSHGEAADGAGRNLKANTKIGLFVIIHCPVNLHKHTVVRWWAVKKILHVKMNKFWCVLTLISDWILRHWFISFLKPGQLSLTLVFVSWSLKQLRCRNIYR